MSDYKEKNAVYALNSYLWKLVEANLGWKKWNSVPPIIPVQQQPEIMQSGTSFMVYGSALHPPGHLYQHKKEAVSYMIYAKTATEVNRIVSLLHDTFERQDVAAADVNDWLVTEEEGRGTHRGVVFTAIRATMAEKAEDPSNEESGYLAGMVMIEATYTADENDTIQTTGFEYP